MNLNVLWLPRWIQSQGLPSATKTPGNWGLACGRKRIAQKRFHSTLNFCLYFVYFLQSGWKNRKENVYVGRDTTLWQWMLYWRHKTLLFRLSWNTVYIGDQLPSYPLCLQHTGEGWDGHFKMADTRRQEWGSFIRMNTDYLVSHLAPASASSSCCRSWRCRRWRWWPQWRRGPHRWAQRWWRASLHSQAWHTWSHLHFSIMA